MAAYLPAAVRRANSGGVGISPHHTTAEPRRRHRTRDDPRRSRRSVIPRPPKGTPPRLDDSPRHPTTPLELPRRTGHQRSLHPLFRDLGNGARTRLGIQLTPNPHHPERQPELAMVLDGAPINDITTRFNAACYGNLPHRHIPSRRPKIKTHPLHRNPRPTPANSPPPSNLSAPRPFRKTKGARTSEASARGMPTPDDHHPVILRLTPSFPPTLTSSPPTLPSKPSEAGFQTGREEEASPIPRWNRSPQVKVIGLHQSDRRLHPH